MKKILYMTLSEHLESDSGVNKKIKSQVRALEKLGHIVHLSGRSKDGYAFFKQEKIIDITVKRDRKSIFNKIFDYLSLNNITVLYMRKITIDYYFLSFVKRLKRHNIRVFIEIPTYPYDQEVEGIRQLIVNLVDRVFRSQVSRCVEGIVTFSQDKEIFGIPCINISNGIDESEIQLNYLENNDILNFVSVSAMRYWHGIDRFLESLALVDDTLKKKIRLHIVGPNNKYCESLKMAVGKLDLRENVKFYGYMNLEQLSKIYKISQFGVGSLGRHRSGIEQLSSLKNREYAAKGLHIIYSEKDLDFDHQCFVYKVGANDEAFDLTLIINDYLNKKVARESIVDFSKKFTWLNQMKKISVHIESGDE
ncbi:glycosyltransferase [Acinetobacter indicus]|uniref:glycosyltransferase n=1 Tax=Acinetobacter indicus TaxID=756892 RepID=UPI003989ECCE